jgi:hypothetical protein
MTANQPYSFGDIRGGIAKAGKYVEGKIEKRGKAAEKELDHQYKIREMAIGTSLKTEAEKQLLKTKGKQERKLAKTKEKAGAKAYGKRLAHSVSSAQQMSTISKPGTGVTMSERSFSFTTPAAAKSAPAAKPSKQSAPAPKPKASLARRAQMGRAMQKKGM